MNNELIKDHWSKTNAKIYIVSVEKFGEQWDYGCEIIEGAGDGRYVANNIEEARDMARKAFERINDPRTKDTE